MPPKKKATPAVGVDTVTSLPPGVKITWQLEDKRKDMWVVFSTEVQDALTAAAMSCRKQLNLKAGPRSALTIDMVKMVQQTSKGAEKRVRGLVENKEVLISWEVKDGEEWQPLQVGVGARLEQVLEISSSVVVGGIKYDLDKMCRDDKTQVRREKQVVKNFMKSSITGNIKVAEKQEYDKEEEMSPAKKVNNNVGLDDSFDWGEFEPPITTKRQLGTTKRDSYICGDCGEQFALEVSRDMHLLVIHKKHTDASDSDDDVPTGRNEKVMV